MWEYIKSAIVSLGTALVAYLDPVAGNIESLLGLFFLNFVVGYFTGMIKNNETFSMRKCLSCFAWAAVIISLICSFYFIGERNGNDEETREFVRWVSLIAIWAFGCNILRNLRHLSYGYGVYYTFFDALYTGISLEFIKRLPFLKNKIIIEDENAHKHGDDRENRPIRRNQAPSVS